MRTSHISLSNPPSNLLSRLMIPNLEVLSTPQLLDLFINIANQFEQAMIKNVSIQELDHLQIQIATIKDEIFKKSDLNREVADNKFFYTSFINKN
jgi:hypothetical protein